MGLQLVDTNYSLTTHDTRAMHEFQVRVCHFSSAYSRVFIVLWVANKMIKYDEHKKVEVYRSSSATFLLPWTGRFDFAQNSIQRSKTMVVSLALKPTKQKEWRKRRNAQAMSALPQSGT